MLVYPRKHLRNAFGRIYVDFLNKRYSFGISSNTKTKRCNKKRAYELDNFCTFIFYIRVQRIRRIHYMLLAHFMKNLLLLKICWHSRLIGIFIHIFFFACNSRDANKCELKICLWSKCGWPERLKLRKLPVISLRSKCVSSTTKARANQI